MFTWLYQCPGFLSSSCRCIFDLSHFLFFCKLRQHLRMNTVWLLAAITAFTTLPLFSTSNGIKDQTIDFLILIQLYFFFWVNDNYIIHTFCLLTNYNVTQTAEDEWEWLATWIRCLHSMVSWIVLEDYS